MAGNYEKGMYNQLMEVMARLDAVEKDLHTEKIEHKEDADCLNARIGGLEQENQLLKEDNARLKSIINNDSSNTSLPPSRDQKGRKPTNIYNSREKTGRKTGGQKGHRGTTLTKADIEEKIKSGRCDTGNGKRCPGLYPQCQHRGDRERMVFPNDGTVQADEPGEEGTDKRGGILVPCGSHREF